MGLPIEFSDIQAAAERLKGNVVRTPLIESPLLNDKIGGRLLIKPECLQKTGSFKMRGAFNRLVQLNEEERKRGVVAFSSGNHAQGVAHAAQILGIPATIVMPADAPAIKLANTKSYGATVVTYDRALESREAKAAEIAQETGATLVPSFEDVHIMAGQGTVGLEIAEDLKGLDLKPDSVLVCCGGGGLSSGSLTALRPSFPDMDFYTVEPENWDDTAQSLTSGQRVSLSSPPVSVCDALLTLAPGVMPLSVLSALGATGLTVTEGEVFTGIRTAFEYLKLVAEPGGAVALAAALANKVDLKDRVTVAVISGGNIDPNTMVRALSS